MNSQTLHCQMVHCLHCKIKYEIVQRQTAEYMIQPEYDSCLLEMVCTNDLQYFR